ncbi:multicomponent Na+:H+ antiporter subunit G [Geodermatophilus dictyosporus]|uniref:Multicomponent Na+:H+ antiporter subunit G n=1 Tax=Geodermatophilus dictyosporus TaxID=1523247 RepID=A0A1I5JTK6_9ACTN|nr:monovalent cation/H(+) antiporter subunit G [Geodermatophilus dictyosporus]SFO76075.1 multicomponent Na+:H+ antiporter subunit G [Geodermatophilus dictyosporus]
MTPQTLVGDVFVGLGVLLIGIAAVGLLRLPDVYNRANAVAKAASLGLVSVLLGVVVLAPSGTAVVVLLVAAALQLFTVPIAGYAIGEAAWLSRAPLVPGTHRDRPDGGGGTGA